MKEAIIKKIDEIAAYATLIADDLLSNNMMASHNLRMIILRLGILRKAVENLDKKHCTECDQLNDDLDCEKGKAQ